MNKQSGSQSGFTLIELMIVVSIVSILTAIALPSYQDYTIRAKVTEGLVMGSAARATVTENLAGRAPINSCDGVTVGVNISLTTFTSCTPGNPTTISISVDTGIDSIVVSMDYVGTPIGGGGGGTEWECTNASDDIYVPAECRS